jgi:hypothetical protein
VHIIASDVHLLQIQIFVCKGTSKDFADGHSVFSVCQKCTGWAFHILLDAFPYGRDTSAMTMMD